MVRRRVLKPNSEQLWTQVESNLTEHQQGEPDRAFWGRFIQKTIGSDSNYTEADLREARKRGYEDGIEDGKQRVTTNVDDKTKRKAEKWDKLEDAGLDRLYRLDQSDIQELKDARKLLRMLDEDGFNAMRNEFDRLVNAVNKFRAPLNRLESVADEDTNDLTDTLNTESQDNTNAEQ